MGQVKTPWGLVATPLDSFEAMMIHREWGRGSVCPAGPVACSREVEECLTPPELMWKDMGYIPCPAGQGLSSHKATAQGKVSKHPVQM